MHSRLRFGLFIGLIAIFATSSPAQALNWNLHFRLCLPELIEVPTLVEDIPIPVGCEVVDCCPGCPGPGPLDWRIRLDGLFTGGALRFEEMPRQGLDALDTGGNVKLDERGAVIGKGSSVIRGLPGAPRRSVAVAFPELTVDREAVLGLSKVYAEGASDLDDDIHAGSLVIEQFLGPVVVNSYRARFHALWCTDFGRPTDRIDLDSNAAGDSAIVVMDSRRPSGCRNDEIVRVTNIRNVGNVRAAAGCNDEIAVFSDDDAMVFDTPVAQWTDPLGDTVEELLPNILTVPVSVWLARPGALVAAQNDFANANLLYNQNNVGIQFNPVYFDVSGNAAAVANIGTWCDSAPAVQGGPNYTANRLNIYYVNAAFTGVNCGFDRNINYLGTTANLGSLPHEIGHAYGLRPSGSGGHVNGLPGFGNNNIMWGGGPGTRSQFTVGQSFRMNVNDNSMLNANGDRTGPTRACAPNIATNLCPTLGLDAVPH